MQQCVLARWSTRSEGYGRVPFGTCDRSFTGCRIRTVMRAALALTLVAVALGATACAGSSSKTTQGPCHGCGTGKVARSAMIRYIRAARASDPILSIFPAQPVEQNCRIPYSGGIDRASYRGRCRTSVSTARNTHEPLELVRFTERWPEWCSGPRDCIAQPPSLHHTWVVLVEPPMISGRKPLVAGKRQSGAQAPQGHDPNRASQRFRARASTG
jgi:hypothetical protein